MNVKKFWPFKTILMLLAVVCLAACNDDDGYKKPMKWKSDVTVSKDGKIQVPVEGGTFVLTCTNYVPSLLNVIVDIQGERQHIEASTDEPGLFETCFATLRMEGNQLTVTMERNNSLARTVEAELFSDDCYERLYFEQLSPLKAE